MEISYIHGGSLVSILVSGIYLYCVAHIWDNIVKKLRDHEDDDLSE
jgi:hypothetical protein